MAITLSKTAVKRIHDSVEALFQRLKGRYLGPGAVTNRGDKRIFIGYRPEFTLANLYSNAAQEERAKPSKESAESLIDIASGYLDATEAATKARVTRAVDAFLKDAEAKGVDTDVETVLGGELAQIWGKTTADVKKILDTEATHARNLGAMEGIARVGAAAGIEDPVIYFVVVNDQHMCGECRRLHLLEDNITPRVWTMSEVSHKHHVRGEDTPCWGGMHPHCRCTPASLMPGYGFKGGSVAYIGVGHDELAKQRG